MSSQLNAVVAPPRMLLVALLLTLLLTVSQALPGFRASIMAPPHTLADVVTSPPVGGGGPGTTPSPKPNSAVADVLPNPPTGGGGGSTPPSNPHPSLADGGTTGHGSTTGGTTVGGGGTSIPS